ncbi:pentapeptide repeat-containing protein [Micromonospora sp.]|uniref:pentapeptide repeat-containing protein n=1 Tax=Micromonospora sp. TaxID=1876 RepID=UPI003B3A5446
MVQGCNVRRERRSRGATFSGNAEFEGATFSGNAQFGGATFSGDAGFEGATFSEDPGFRETMAVGEVTRPDGTNDPATSTPRPIQQSLFPET